MATKRAKPAAKRVRNISEGYMDANGVFHPIRSASDYRAKRAGEVKKYATGRKRKVSKAKKTVTVSHKRVAAKKTLAELRKLIGSPRREWTAAEKKKYSPAQRAAMQKPVAVKNPLPTGKWTKVDKVKVRSDGSIQIMIRPGR